MPTIGLMKTPHPAEVIIGREMKPPVQHGAPVPEPGQSKRRPGSFGFNSRPFGPARFGMPMEWVGGSTWRLPSGKALAEFALQAGFLAPLMLGSGVPGAPSTSAIATPGGGIKRRKAADLPLPVAGTHEGSNELEPESVPPRGTR